MYHYWQNSDFLPLYHIGHPINSRKLFSTYFIVLIDVCSFLTHFPVSQSGSDWAVHHYFNIFSVTGRLIINYSFTGRLKVGKWKQGVSLGKKWVTFEKSMDKANFYQKESEKKVKKGGKKCGRVKKQFTFGKKGAKSWIYKFSFFSLPAFLWTLSPAPSFYISKPCPHLFLTCEERRSLYRTSTSTLHQFSASGKLPWPPSSFPKPYYVPYMKSMCTREQ